MLPLADTEESSSHVRVPVHVYAKVACRGWVRLLTLFLTWPAVKDVGYVDTFCCLKLCVTLPINSAKKKGVC